MQPFLLITGSIIILLFIGHAFYIALKKYEEDDDFIGDIDSFTLIDL